MKRWEQFPTPGISPELLRVTIIMLVTAAILMWFISCDLYKALIGTVESGGEAADAARDAADQTADTLQALEHVFVGVGAYLMGELRRPMWSKFRERRNGPKARNRSAATK